MGELVEGALDAEVGAEGEREDGRVRRQVAAGVVADEQHRALLGHVAEAADLAAEPDAARAATGAGASRGCSRGRARRGRRSGTPATCAATAAAAPPRGSGRGRSCVRRVMPLCRPLVPAERVDAREEALQQAVRALRDLDLRHVAAALEHDLLGARQPALDVVAEALRDQPVVRGPDEQRGRLQRRQARIEALAPERRLEVDRAGAGEERQARAGRAVDALELVDDDVGHARVDQVAVGEQRPERLLDPLAAERVGEHAELGAGEAHEPVPVAAHERHGGAQQRDPADAVGPLEADLDRHPAAHGVADEVGALDARARPSCRSPRGPRTARRRARSRAWRSRRSPAGRSRGRV